MSEIRNQGLAVKEARVEGERKRRPELSVK
jgi:hypothetical protein